MKLSESQINVIKQIVINAGFSFRNPESIIIQTKIVNDVESIEDVADRLYKTDVCFNRMVDMTVSAIIDEVS